MDFDQYLFTPPVDPTPEEIAAETAQHERVRQIVIDAGFADWADAIDSLYAENAALRAQLEKARAVVKKYANRDMWTDVVAEEYEPEEAPSYWVEAHTPWYNVFECEGDGWELAATWLQEQS